ncbi:MAG: hypothetical protein M1823_005296 [Watsoniomyces obsoletus]|nr:MAG: hypothetical protein M1823_005296 [Watsoniomyces obsoletus]
MSPKRAAESLETTMDSTAPKRVRPRRESGHDMAPNQRAALDAFATSNSTMNAFMGGRQKSWMMGATSPVAPRPRPVPILASQPDSSPSLTQLEGPMDHYLTQSNGRPQDTAERQPSQPVMRQITTQMPPPSRAAMVSPERLPAVSAPPAQVEAPPPYIRRPSAFTDLTMAAPTAPSHSNPTTPMTPTTATLPSPITVPLTVPHSQPPATFNASTTTPPTNLTTMASPASVATTGTTGAISSPVFSTPTTAIPFATVATLAPSIDLTTTVPSTTLMTTAPSNTSTTAARPTTVMTSTPMQIPTSSWLVPPPPPPSTPADRTVSEVGQKTWNIDLSPHVPVMQQYRNVFSSMSSPQRHLLISRVDLILQACHYNDLFYVAMHQLYCDYTLRPAVVAQLASLGPNEQSGMQALNELLSPNQSLPANFLRQQANFPSSWETLRQFSASHRTALGAVRDALGLLGLLWKKYEQACLGRGYPPLTSELVSTFNVKSVVLQRVIFRAICRRLGGVASSQGGLERLEQIYRADQVRFYAILSRMHTAWPTTIPLAARVNDQTVAFYRTVQAELSQNPSQTLAHVQAQAQAQAQSFAQAHAHVQAHAQAQAQAQGQTHAQAQAQAQAQAHAHAQALAEAQRQMRTQTTSVMIPNGPPTQTMAPPASPPIQTVPGIAGTTGGTVMSPVSGPTISSPLSTTTTTAVPAPSGIWTVNPRGGYMFVPTTSGPVPPVTRTRSHPILAQQQSQVVPIRTQQVPIPGRPSPRHSISVVPSQPAVISPQSPYAVSTAVPFVSAYRPTTTTTPVIPPAPRPLLTQQFPLATTTTPSQPPPAAVNGQPRGVNPLMTALHQAHLRAPHLMHVHPAPSNEDTMQRLYRYVDRWVIPPKLFPDQFCILKEQFRLDESTTTTTDGILPRRLPEATSMDGLPIVVVTERTKNYRVRCCRVKTGIENLSIDEWLTQENIWPEHIFLSINRDHIDVRRRGHHGRDIPLDISLHVHPGENTLDAVLSRNIEDVKTGIPYAVAVEMIQFQRGHSIIEDVMSRDFFFSAKSMHAWLSKQMQQPSSSSQEEEGGDGDEELAIVSQSITLSVTDPYTAIMWEVPVRARGCQHRDCFDLRTFLAARPMKTRIKVDQNSLPRDVLRVKSAEDGLLYEEIEASDPDQWKCPLCGGDARPTMLAVDEYFSDVRRVLVERGQLDVKAIVVASDGSWEVKGEGKVGEKGDGGGEEEDGQKEEVEKNGSLAGCHDSPRVVAAGERSMMVEVGHQVQSLTEQHEMNVTSIQQLATDFNGLTDQARAMQVVRGVGPDRQSSSPCGGGGGGGDRAK